MTPDILSRLKKTVSRYKMIVPGDTVLAACSGGADSTALLHLLVELRRDIPFRLVVAHFNHMLRAAADSDERFVWNVARSMGLRVLTARRDVRAYARRRRLNLEEAARILRYKFLERAAARCGATKIATGHTLNDQAETFLMRLLRGSGPRGLAGIYPVRGGRIVRPLIEISRRDVEAYCRVNKLAFRTDETNLDSRYLRNRIRKRLVPYLERHFEPALMVKLGRQASIYQEDENVLESAARAQAARLIVGESRGAALDARKLARLPRGSARRVVRAFIEAVAGNLRSISFEDIEAVLDLSDRKELTLPKRLHLRREGNWIKVKEKSPAPARFALLWDGRGELPIPGTKMRFLGRRMKRKMRGADTPLSFDNKTRCFCDAEKVRFPLLVRTRQPGDRFRPLGAPGRQNLNEALRAKGVSAPARAGLPVFCSGEEIVWVPGLPVAEQFKIDKATKKIFIINKRI